MIAYVTKQWVFVFLQISPIHFYCKCLTVAKIFALLLRKLGIDRN